MADQRLRAQMAFLIELDQMKELYRQSSIYSGRRMENDAEHSWHVTVMAMVLREYAAEDVEIAHVLELLATHDLIEIYAGDTFAYDEAAKQDKYLRESASADRLYALLPEDQTPRFRALWEEYESRATPEARFAAAMDRLQPLLSNWLNEGANWKAHDVRAAAVRRRMAPIRESAPALWALTEELIDASVARGYLSE
ncbi:MAG: HD domain-containing protein [Ruminococcaceae bacterium]|nr:HD domain-containing protein [Oscillospiraceae bacterium]